MKCRFLACTGWCKTLGFLMSVKPEGLLGDIKMLMFCIIQCNLRASQTLKSLMFCIIQCNLRASQTLKSLMFCIIQCKLKIWISILIFTFYIINLIYLIIFHPNSLVILEKWNILFVTEVLEQTANESTVHDVVAIREWRHTNADKQRKLLVDIDVTPPRGAA